MIALTQEKREELIACANEIKKMATSTHGYKVGNDAFGSNALMLMEIALASLTAEPVAEIKCLEDLSLEVVNVSDGFNLGRHAVFTASPVPEIKLPDRDKLPGWARNHEDSLDWYESEIKRLNGLGE